MKISLEKLASEAEATGFRPDILEKVAHLLGLLEAVNAFCFELQTASLRRHRSRPDVSAGVEEGRAHVCG